MEGWEVRLTTAMGIEASPSQVYYQFCDQRPDQRVFSAVPIRTPAEQPIRLYDWTVRFYDVGELTQPSQEIANAHLAEFLHRSATAAAAAGPIPTIQQLIESARVDDASPWYNEYCEEYFRMLKFASHEAVDHPVICKCSFFLFLYSIIQ